MLMRASLLAALSLAVSAINAHATCVANYIVDDTPTSGPTLTTYNFAVVAGCDTSNQFDELFVPYFSDAEIGDITTPDGWTYTISPSDLFGLGSETLEFVPTTPLTGLEYGTTITGISFTSPFAPVNGPIGTTQTISGTTIYSDPPIPGSPDTIEALGGTAVPEPSTVVFTALSVLFLAAFARKRLRSA